MASCLLVASRTLPSLPVQNGPLSSQSPVKVSAPPPQPASTQAGDPGASWIFPTPSDPGLCPGLSMLSSDCLSHYLLLGLLHQPPSWSSLMYQPPNWSSLSTVSPLVCPPLTSKQPEQPVKCKPDLASPSLTLYGFLLGVG